MENVELYREQIDSKIVGIETYEEAVRFKKEDGGKIDVSYSHDQECCESVYADFSTIKYQENDIIGKKFKELVVKGVDGIGFLLCFYQDWEVGEKIFVPCYNKQNGWYSSNLGLTVNGKSFDISGFVEDHID